MKRRLLVLVATLCTVASVTAYADPPDPEPRVVPGASQVLPAARCAPESYFETFGSRFDPSPPYDKCERLKVVFGPIWAKPGQNDVLIQAVTFEKPLYPGYLVRFKPDLVAVDGNAPRVKDLHLHHGTWLNPNFLVGDQLAGSPVNPTRPYGWGPWIASGEEKTVAVWPRDYGLKILPSDQWEFLHMIHNATPQTFPVWVTYDLDFIPQEAAEAINPSTGKPYIHNTKGIWLDVGDCSWSSQCKKDSFNPVFNVQRGYGIDGVCVFPRENCAQQNTLAGTSAQQGVDLGTTYDDWTVRESGTLTMMGGHLHFGGLRDDVYLLRETSGALDADCRVAAGKTPTWDSRLIHISDALYWDQDFDPNTWQPSDAFDPSKNVVGGVPTSWDMVMTGVTKDLGWAVEVRKCDKLRLEGIYDSTIGTWYEQMGIVMTWLAPGDTSGVDPFDEGVTIKTSLNNTAQNPVTAPGYTLPGDDGVGCDPGPTTICVRGQATHSRIPTSGDHWSCQFNGCPDIARKAPSGIATTNIHIGGFTYGEADFGAIPSLGVPTVKVNTPVTFWNVDTADYMWHTVTRCANPCSGTTSASYPVPDGQWDDVIETPPPTLTDPLERARWVQDQIAQEIATRGPDPMDFDSGQIGVGTGANQKVSWTWKPTRTGTFSFFCRIHPSMRGAIRVVS